MKSMTDSFIALAEVKRRTGMGETFIRSHGAAGDFPPFVKCGRHTRWSSLEIDAWIEDKKAHR